MLNCKLFHTRSLDASFDSHKGEKIQTNPNKKYMANAEEVKHHQPNFSILKYKLFTTHVVSFHHYFKVATTMIKHIQNC